MRLGLWVSFLLITVYISVVSFICIDFNISESEKVYWQGKLDASITRIDSNIRTFRRFLEKQ